jgi:hypothetical protein
MAFLAWFAKDNGYYLWRPAIIKATTLNGVWEECQNHDHQDSPVGRSLAVMDIIEDDDGVLWLITSDGFQNMGPSHWNVPRKE